MMYFKSGSSQQPDFKHDFGPVAHGNHKLVPNEASNWFNEWHSLFIHPKVPHTRIWAPGNRYWPRGWATGAPLGRSIAMMEERDDTMIFRSNFFQNHALRTQYDSLRTKLPPMGDPYAWGWHRGTTYSNMGAVGPVWTEIGAALGRFWEPWWEGFCQKWRWQVFCTVFWWNKI